MPIFHFHPGFGGNSIRTNPWIPTQFIIATADNFGISGSGKVYIVDVPRVDAGGLPVPCVGAIATADCAFDACFNEVNGNIFVVGCGDGVHVYSKEMLPSAAAQGPSPPPIASNREHSAEIAAIAWNPAMHDIFATGSWDGSLKVFGAENIAQSRNTFAAHMKQVYDVSWCPRSPHLLASASGDGACRIFDIRSGRSVAALEGAHNNNIVMSCHWNYYEPTIIGTAGTDNTAKIWDVRRPQQPLMPLLGHQAPVRRIRFSPHTRSHVLTSGYDFRVCYWDMERPRGGLAFRHDHHKEFVVGVEWSQVVPGAVASASWDGTACFWQLGQPVLPSPPAPLPPLIPPPKLPRRPGMAPAGLSGLAAPPLPAPPGVPPPLPQRR